MNFNASNFSLLFATSVILLASGIWALSSVKPSYYWRNLRWIVFNVLCLFSENRRLECANHGVNISRCSLKEDGRDVELNPGCFDELDNVQFIGYIFNY